MTENKGRYLAEKYQKQIDGESLGRFGAKLKQADDRVFDPMQSVSLKSIPVTILLSFFLGFFSAGRFYIGDKKFAGKKFSGICAILVFGGFCASMQETLAIFSILYALSFVTVGIWNLVDIYFTVRAAKRFNGAYLIGRLDTLMKESAQAGIVQAEAAQTREGV